MTKKVVEWVTKGELSPLQALRAFNSVVEAYYAYMRVVEEEATKRRDIEAWEKTQITGINAKRDFFLSYIDKAFAERAENFRRLFNSLDGAMAGGSIEQLGLILHQVTELAKHSVFSDLADLERTKLALKDPNQHWEV